MLARRVTGSVESRKHMNFGRLLFLESPDAVVDLQAIDFIALLMSVIAFEMDLPKIPHVLFSGGGSKQTREFIQVLSQRPALRGFFVGAADKSRHIG